jgi:hypothetical protein
MYYVYLLESVLDPTLRCSTGITLAERNFSILGADSPCQFRATHCNHAGGKPRR